MARSFLQTLHNPRNKSCGCSPECWCKTTTLGRMFRWWFPARWFGIRHKSKYSGLEKRRMETNLP
jgi:hypothetical protein